MAAFNKKNTQPMARTTKTTAKKCNIDVDLKNVDPWNIQQWKDWEYCQGSYKRIYALDTLVPRQELYLVNEFINQLNDDYKFQRHFLLVTKLPITLEKKPTVDTLSFFVYDTKSTITRLYTFEYQWLNKKQVKIIKGFRSKTELEDQVLMSAAGYNCDQYNQLGQRYASYMLDLDESKPRLAPFPLNPNIYNYSNAPNNSTSAATKIMLPEKSGLFKASNFSSAAY